MTIFEQLIRDEGVKFFPYVDSVGKTTIGIGRNLTDDGISFQEAKYLLTNDVQNAVAQLEKNFPWAVGLDDARHGVLVNMTFNMGIRRLAEFKNFLAAMEREDWATAKAEMLDSLWAKQVGARAERLALQIETGAWQ